MGLVHKKNTTDAVNNKSLHRLPHKVRILSCRVGAARWVKWKHVARGIRKHAEGRVVRVEPLIITWHTALQRQSVSIVAVHLLRLVGPRVEYSMCMLS